MKYQSSFTFAQKCDKDFLPLRGSLRIRKLEVYPKIEVKSFFLNNTFTIVYVRHFLTKSNSYKSNFLDF